MRFWLQKVNEFLSTPSARRATIQLPHDVQIWPISIHALREEGDTASPAFRRRMCRFLSTPSARRATSTRQTFVWI